MTVNDAALRVLIETTYTMIVNRQLGDVGTRALREVIATVTTLYKYLEPNEVGRRVVVFQSVTTEEGTEVPEHPTTLPHPSVARVHLEAGLAIEILASGALALKDLGQATARELSADAVVYVYDGGAEYIYARGVGSKIENVYEGAQSAFAKPYFHDLREALDHYGRKFVRTSFCPIFKETWYDQNRLFFRAHPEHLMRDSLERHLVSFLRGDAEVVVMPEQNVNTSRPIDIKVTYRLHNRVALMEIKWLGKSRHPDGSMATRFTPARAREGADQLAEYLDIFRERAVDTVTEGYLVVIDARRRGLSIDSISVSLHDGMYFENAEIEYSPEYHKLRNDFNEPVRMFAEPVT